VYLIITKSFCSTVDDDVCYFFSFWTIDLFWDKGFLSTIPSFFLRSYLYYLLRSLKILWIRPGLTLFLCIFLILKSLKCHKKIRQVIDSWTCLYFHLTWKSIFQVRKYQLLVLQFYGEARQAFSKLQDNILKKLFRFTLSLWFFCWCSQPFRSIVAKFYRFKGKQYFLPSYCLHISHSQTKVCLVFY